MERSAAPLPFRIPRSPRRAAGRGLVILVLAVLIAACGKGRTVDVGDFGGGGDDTPASGCGDDPREEDDEVAYVLAKSAKDGEKFDAMSCPGDDDFIHLFAEGRTGAVITWSPGDGKVRVDLLDKSGALMRQGTTDFTEVGDGRVVIQRQNVRGDFFLRVRNRAGTPVRYHVEIGAAAGDVPAPSNP